MNSTGQYQLATTNGEITVAYYKSNNFGGTWTRVHMMNANGNRFFSCVSMSSSGQYQYLGGGGGAGYDAYYSTNYGTTFSLINPANSAGNRVSCSFSNTYARAIVVETFDACIFKCDLNTSYQYEQKFDLVENIVDPTLVTCDGASKIFWTNTGVYGVDPISIAKYSSDDGTTWSYATLPGNLNTVVYHTTYGGKLLLWGNTFTDIYFSDDNGTRWTKIPTGLTNIYCLCASLTNDYVYVLTQNGLLYYMAVGHYQYGFYI